MVPGGVPVWRSSRAIHLSAMLQSGDLISSAVRRRTGEYPPARLLLPGGLALPHQVVRLRVRDLEEAKRFYVSALGLKITKEAPGLVTLADVLALSSRESRREQQGFKSGTAEVEPMHVYIETRDLDAAHRNVRNARTTRLTEISSSDNRRRFTCCDPDGNLVEVFESRR